jgi:hypothetical protein
MPKSGGDCCKEFGCWELQRVQGSRAVTSDELAPCGKILNRATKRVKFHRTVIVSGETTDRNKVFNEIRRNKDVV